MYLVYKHTTLSGKVYIGITKQTAQRRWGKNGCGYKDCPCFYGAIQKYGWDNIKHEVLHEGLSKEQAREYEKRYIEEYNATDSRFGYNLTSGGETGFAPNEEVRRKMSESHKKFYELHPEERQKRVERAANYRHSEEAKKKISDANKRRHLTDESKKKMSEAAKRRLLEDEAWYQAASQRVRESGKKTARKVEQIDMDGNVVAVYESMKAAGRATGINYGNICNVCRGRAKKAGGYGWRYAI